MHDVPKTTDNYWDEKNHHDHIKRFLRNLNSSHHKKLLLARVLVRYRYNIIYNMVKIK